MPVEIANVKKDFILMYIDNEKEIVSVNIKDIAIYANMGTVKLYNELQNLGGSRMNNSIMFNNKDEAENAIEWIEKVAIMNKISGKQRPNY